jgi:hypothetical protein
LATAGNGAIVVAMDMWGNLFVIVSSLIKLAASLPITYETAADFMTETLDWTLAGHLDEHIRLHLLSRDASAANGIFCDFDRLTLASHSSGAQSLILTYERRSAKIAALLMYDPVDGLGPPRGDVPDALKSSANALTSYPPFTLTSALRQSLVSRLANNAGYPPAVVNPKNTTQFATLNVPTLFLTSGLCAIPAGM